VDVLDADPGQVLRDWIVEMHLAGVSLLEYRDAREQLRDRADAVERVGARQGAGLEVGQAEGACRQELLVVDDADRHPRDAVERGLVLDPLFPGRDGIHDPQVGAQWRQSRPNARNRNYLRQNDCSQLNHFHVPPT
jgi:hypothetical protein